MSGPVLVHAVPADIPLGEEATATCGFVWVPTKRARQLKGIPYCPVCFPKYAVRYAPARDEDPHYVYRLYDAQDGLLYIGATVDPRTRRLGHKKKEWWPQVHHFRLTVYPDRETALRVEAEAIRTEHPLHNVRHKLKAVPA